MKTTLIYPRGYWKGFYPPLGIGYLSAALKEYGIDVDFIDGQLLSSDEYEKRLVTVETTTVCISWMLPQYQELLKTCRYLREMHPNLKIIVGGPGNEPVKDDLLSKNLIDIIFIGEGETRLPLLLEYINDGKSYSTIPGLLFMENEMIQYTGEAELLDINQLAIPDRSIFDMNKYFDNWREIMGYTSVHLVTSRGCSHKCAFCDRALFGNQYRGRCVQLVFEEMKRIEKEFQPDDIFIHDDNFTADKTRVMDLCNLLTEEDFQSRWSAHARVDQMDMSLAKKLYKAGCKELYFGVESGSQRVLDTLKKGITIAQIQEAFRCCHEVGISPCSYFITGVPGETIEDLEATKKLIAEIRPSALILSHLAPMPGTELWERYQNVIAFEGIEQIDFTYGKSVFSNLTIDPIKAKEDIYWYWKGLEQS